MDDKKWVSMWGNAISIANRLPENYSKNLTLRYPIHPVFDGDRLRLTFDNFCGTEDVTLTKAVVAKADGPRGIFEDTVVPVTFGGAASAVLPAGEAVVSDAIVFPVKRGEDISVSMYFGDFTLMRSSVMITGPLSKGAYAVGDCTECGELPLDETRNTNWFYFLSNIDILTDVSNRAVICYGDSITSQDWPDYLTLRLEQEGHVHTSVVRKAASGTRILRQYDNITYDSYGLKGKIRFPREAQVSGADTVIIQHGINDIIHPVGADVNPFRPWSDMPTAQELIDGIRWYIEQARDYGLKVYLGTLLPIEGWRTYERFREDIREEVNAWMRTAHEADGCIDFDEALRNPVRPRAFAPGFDSGDHLHPSKAAYEKMAQTVPDYILK